MVSKTTPQHPQRPQSPANPLILPATYQTTSPAHSSRRNPSHTPTATHAPTPPADGRKQHRACTSPSTHTHTRPHTQSGTQGTASATENAILSPLSTSATPPCPCHVTGSYVTKTQYTISQHKREAVQDPCTNINNSLGGVYPTTRGRRCSL